jgi:hypothetical protein
MKKAYAVVLSVLMCMSLVAFSTGCGKALPLTPVQIISLIETQLPGDLTLAASIAKLAGNASLSDILVKISNMSGTDLPIIQAAVTAWKASQTAGNLAALASAVNTLAAKINKQVLAANGLISTDADAIAMGVVAGLSLAINGWAIALGNMGSTSATLTVPDGFREVRAITPRVKVEEVAREFGVPVDVVYGL